MGQKNLDKENFEKRIINRIVRFLDCITQFVVVGIGKWEEGVIHRRTRYRHVTRQNVQLTELLHRSEVFHEEER